MMCFLAGEEFSALIPSNFMQMLICSFCFMQYGTIRRKTFHRPRFRRTQYTRNLIKIVHTLGWFKEDKRLADEYCSLHTNVIITAPSSKSYFSFLASDILIYD